MRTDDLGAVPLRALMARNPKVDWQAITDVIFGCANQAGEDNRNVAHMASLLAGLPLEVPGATLNRLCGSGLDALGTAARAIRAGEAGLMIAGGVESMSRAPFVMPKAESAFSRNNAVYDTTIGWRFINKLMKEKYGVDSMPETAENVATDFKIEREAQDRMALASQLNAVAAQKAGHLAREITPVSIPQKKGDAIIVDTDEHPRATTLETLAQLKGVVPDIVLPSVTNLIPGFGEADLLHALAWEQIPTSVFDGSPLDAKVLTPLRQSSLERQEKLEEFAYLRKNIEWFKARQEQKLISVNLDERKQQKATDDAFRKSMNAEKKLLAKNDYTFKEFRLGPPALPRIKAPKKDADKDADADDDDDAVEEENDTYIKNDVHLRETLRVVSDAVSLGTNKADWASDRAPLTARSGG